MSVNSIKKDFITSPKTQYTKQCLDDVLFDSIASPNPNRKTVSFQLESTDNSYTATATKFTDGKYEVTVHWTGIVIVRENDWISKYSSAMYDGDTSKIYEFERVDETEVGHSFVPLQDPNLIISKEIIFHSPTRFNAIELLEYELNRAKEDYERIGSELNRVYEKFNVELKERQPYSEKFARPYANWLQDWAQKGCQTCRAFASVVLCIPIPILAMWGHLVDSVPFPISKQKPYPQYEEIDGLDISEVDDFLNRINGEIQVLNNLIWFLSGT